MKLETDIKYIKEEQDLNRVTNKSEHEEIKLMIKDFINGADKKYASKLSETIVYALVGIILTAVIVGIISLVVT